jgi:hypothetical protein
MRTNLIILSFAAALAFCAPAAYAAQNGVTNTGSTQNGVTNTGDNVQLINPLRGATS